MNPSSLTLRSSRKLLLLGAALVTSAATAQAQAAPWFEFDNAVADHWRSLNVERIGDVTGDGVADMLLGDPLYVVDPTQPGPGQIQIRSGADGSFVYDIVGPTPNDEFGVSTADIGDVDGDGIADFAVGAPRDLGTAGRVHVYSGIDGALLFSVDGDSGERLGTAVCSLGDVNADGIPDFVATHPGALLSGGGDILSGADGAVLDSVGGGSFSSDDYATSATNLGDVDGDGIADFALGAPNEGGGTGWVRTYSGATGDNLYTVNGLVLGELFGEPLEAIADVDGDGVNDFAASATRSVNGGLTTGQVRVFSGVDGDFLYDVTGTLDAQYLGIALASLPDVDGDGIGDLLVSDTVMRPTGNGTVHLLSGFDGATIQSRPGRDASSFLGMSMSALDDVNGDGSIEFVVVSQGDFFVGAPARVTVFATGCATETMPVCTSLPNSTGMVGTLSVSGCGDSTIGGTLELVAADLPANQFGIMVMSQVASNAPLGSGILCVGLPFVRLLEPGGVILNSGPTGSIVSHYDLGSLPQMTQVVAGSTWRFQLYHRDVSPPGSNLTNSVALTF